MSDPRVPGLFLVAGHVCTADCYEGLADGTIAFRRDRNPKSQGTSSDDPRLRERAVGVPTDGGA
jgi:hypothetical protein